MNKNKFSGAIYFIFGFLFLATGIIMLAFDITKVGKHYLTQQPSTIGGYIVLFIGFLSFIVGYFCLSPFSKIREFIEGRSKNRGKSEK